MNTKITQRFMWANVFAFILPIGIAFVPLMRYDGSLEMTDIIILMFMGVYAVIVGVFVVKHAMDVITMKPVIIVNPLEIEISRFSGVKKIAVVSIVSAYMKQVRRNSTKNIGTRYVTFLYIVYLNKQGNPITIRLRDVYTISLTEITECINNVRLDNNAVDEYGLQEVNEVKQNIASTNGDLLFAGKVLLVALLVVGVFLYTISWFGEKVPVLFTVITYVIDFVAVIGAIVYYKVYYLLKQQLYILLYIILLVVTIETFFIVLLLFW